MGMISEFKSFAIQGSVADMAVGIIVDAAFGKIVSSFVADVIMPPYRSYSGRGEFYEPGTDHPGSLVAMLPRLL